MKIMKKIAVAVFAGAMVFGLVSCGDTVGETGKIGKDIDLSNETTTNYNRGYTTLKTKHTSASAIVTLPVVNESLDGETDNTHGNGVIGFIFGIKDVKDEDNKTVEDVKDFCLVGLRREKNNVVNAYTSAFKNVSVKEEHLNLGGNFADKNGNVIGKEGSEAKELGSDKDYKKVTEAPAEKEILLRVEVVAGGPDTDGDGKVEDGEGDGSYNIAIYNVADDGETKSGNALYTATIKTSETGDTKATQYDLGLYTNVYAQQKLNGKLYLTDTVNEAGILLD
ncbi:MAG: hypothetical protein PUE59_02000 [Treponema sp.]|nr:hypothetical protein [Treponema sp.]